MLYMFSTCRFETITTVPSHFYISQLSSFPIPIIEIGLFFSTSTVTVTRIHFPFLFILSIYVLKISYLINNCFRFWIDDESWATGGTLVSVKIRPFANDLDQDQLLQQTEETSRAWNLQTDFSELPECTIVWKLEYKLNDTNIPSLSRYVQCNVEILCWLEIYKLLRDCLPK